MLDEIGGDLSCVPSGSACAIQLIKVLSYLLFIYDQIHLHSQLSKSPAQWPGVKVKNSQ